MHQLRLRGGRFTEEHRDVRAALQGAEQPAAGELADPLLPADEQHVVRVAVSGVEQLQLSLLPCAMELLAS